MSDKIIIATIVYGEYVELFEKACMRSLAQEGNVPSLVLNGFKVKHVIYTVDENLLELKEVVGRCGLAGVDYCFDTMATVDEDFSVNNTQFLKNVVQTGVNEDSRVLFINPDFFFGDGSISNLVGMYFEGHMCIAGAHMRVIDTEFLQLLEYNNETISNPKLVDLAMDCPHKSWSEADISVDSNNSYDGGTPIQQVNHNLWVTTHFVPTVFLADFIATDVDRIQDFGHWDHLWPIKLMSEKRYKLIGSSTLFFAVELTKYFNNVPKLNPKMLGNDKYHSTREHSNINRNFLIALEGE